MAYWLHCEDFASALIGPFKEQEALIDHVGFCIRRGDGGIFQVIPEEAPVYETYREKAHLIMTPEEDREKGAP